MQPALRSITLKVLLLVAMCGIRTFAVSPPTSQPTNTFNIGLPTELPPIYIASPAPAVVHVNALNLCQQPTDWLTEHDSWNFGDTAPQPIIDPRTGQILDTNTALPGPVAAHLYERPGAYSITLTRTLATGQTFTYESPVIVPASIRTVYYISPDGDDINPGTDPAHPLRTAMAAAQLLADHTEFRFHRGGVYPIDREFPLKHHDLLIDCYGDPAAALPVIQRLPTATAPADVTMTFTFWPGLTQDVTVRHLRIDSPFTIRTTGAGYAYHSAGACFGILRGRNVTVADCEFLNLLEGPHGDPTATGVLLLRNRQIDPLGIVSRTLWLEGADVVAIANTALNSPAESPLRAAATGINRGLIAFNDIAQQLDPAHDRALTKAAVTLRTLCDVMVFANRVTNGEFSFDPHTDSAQDLRVRVDSNIVYNSFFDLKSNIRHALFTNNAVHRDQGPCFTINPAGGTALEWIQDLTLQNNTGDGSQPNGRMLQMNDHTVDQLRGFICDPAANVYTRIAMPKELLISK